MNGYGMRTHYLGPDNRLPLMFERSTGVHVRIGWIYVDAMGWPRVEVERVFLT